MLDNKQIKEFENYLLNTQKKWAKELILHEKKAKWSITNENQKNLTSKIYHIKSGETLEKMSINFTKVFGESLSPYALGDKHNASYKPFQALNISTICHPQNPYVPALHANMRLFISYAEEPIWWFGAAMDINPCYGFIEDCHLWHNICKKACEGFGKNRYQICKDACDNYFYLPHRNEYRGIGGLWVEKFNEKSFSFSKNFIESIGNHVMLGFLPILSTRDKMHYNEEQKQYQEYRRGRYVEFNLLYDRGTRYGLSASRRAEAVLASMPPRVNWEFDYKPKPNSEEEKLLKNFLIKRNWLNETQNELATS